MSRKSPPPGEEPVHLYVSIPRKFHSQFKALAQLRSLTPGELLWQAFEKAEGQIEEALKKELARQNLI